MNLPVRVYHVCSMEKRSRFTTGTPRRVGDTIVELRDLGFEFSGCPHGPGMAPYVDPTLAKEAVPSNVIEMLLRVDHTQLVTARRGGSVPMDGLRR